MVMSLEEIGLKKLKSYLESQIETLTSKLLTRHYHDIAEIRKDQGLYQAYVDSLNETQKQIERVKHDGEY